MIKIKSVSYKNFQSVGNRPITIDLTKSPTTMVSGKNGAGKSNVLEALSYGLFGKSLKKVNLSGLINTINKKNLLVTVEFNEGGVDYKVIRGQKPAVLEFYKNDEMIDQNAASKDYQQKIEYVLGMDHKMFTQVVVLNKEKYVPFLELGAADRRKIVEDILDISVFSVMADNLKLDIRENSTAVQDATYELDKAKSRVASTQRLIDESSGAIQEQIDELEQEILVNDERSSEIDVEIARLKSTIPDVAELSKSAKEIQEKIKKFDALVISSNTKLSDLKKTAAFYVENDKCPTCEAAITQESKAHKADHCQRKSTEIIDLVQQIAAEKQKLNDKLQVLLTQLQAAEVTTRQIGTFEISRRNYENNTRNLQSKIATLNQKKNASVYHSELATNIQDVNTKTDALEKLLEEQETLNKCKDLLKDDAIKASVVREYIDFINGRVNEYLAVMEFFINIQLDENFNESIQSVNREGFTYDNLSTGQKCRVSLAIWMALLEVASLKNSVVTNVLVLDEILEPMDPEGVSLFMKLVNEKLPNKNTFVVTQRAAEFADFFRSELKFELKEGFTELA